MIPTPTNSGSPFLRLRVLNSGTHAFQFGAPKYCSIVGHALPGQYYSLWGIDPEGE